MIKRFGRKRRAHAKRPVGASPDDPAIVFMRNVHSFTGGHLKAWDYFNHVAAFGNVPHVVFTPDSVWDERNPWTAAELVDGPLPPSPRALFIGGMHWNQIPKAYDGQDIPVINLVQHVRHADPNDPRSAFLERRAIRICVSPEVADAVNATGRANGPVITIPNGIDVMAVARERDEAGRQVDLLVVANKQPEMGRSLAGKLQSSAATIEVIDTIVPRDYLLHAMGRARVALFVPDPTEGFYLPALEAMALGAIVVCPDCVGNRSFCIDGETAFRPDADEGAIVAAVKRALSLDTQETAQITSSAFAMATTHDLSVERSRVHDVLRDLEELWQA